MMLLYKSIHNWGLSIKYVGNKFQQISLGFINPEAQKVDKVDLRKKYRTSQALNLIEEKVCWELIKSPFLVHTKCMNCTYRLTKHTRKAEPIIIFLP